MLHTKDFLQHFRDAEADGKIGIRGYFGYFMDVATEFWYNIHKGNDVLPEEYGCAWVYSKYSLSIRKKEAFVTPFHVETWLSQQKKARVWQDMEISCDGEIYCSGRVESCIMHLEEKKLKPLSAVGIQDDLKEDRMAEVQDFLRPEYDLNTMEEVYNHLVRYSDLDKSNHMANLKYIPMFLDVYGPDFYETHFLTNAQIHYLSQAYCGETLRILKKEDQGYTDMVAVKEDGSIATWFHLEYE